jgi:Legume lectin domain.
MISVSSSCCARYYQHSWAIYYSCAILLLSIIISKNPVNGDFTFSDFNQTRGLVLNGNASISNCIDTADKQSDSGYDNTKVTTVMDNGQFEIIETTTTSTNEDDNKKKNMARSNKNDGVVSNIPLVKKFGHRDRFKSKVLSKCPNRIRLTSAGLSQSGSMFYEKRLHVIKGFDTEFSFHITGQSKTCSVYVDRMTSEVHHKSCAVQGGDGFAFVIQLDKDHGARAIGGNGKEMGYGGISNALAVEFDMWTNVDTQGSDDLFHDHISIHSASVGINSAEASTMIGNWRPVELSDGKVHRARIQYLPYVEEKYIEFMSANELLLPYIKGNGEGRPLGTLAVFIDDGITRGEPIIAIPLNLSVLLDLPQSVAYIGFTASTGAKWENHDILDWYWCDSITCNHK